jgi:hypothetical protein
MRQYGLLAAVFGGTLAVLLVAFLVIEQLGASGASAVASPSPSTPVALASGTPRPTPRPSAAASGAASTAPSTPSGSETPQTAAPSPVMPTPTPRPSRSVPPVGNPGDTVTVVVNGNQFVKSVVPTNAKVTRLPSGAALLTSDRTYSDPTTVTYVLPQGSLPAGTKISRLDVAVCGDGSGDFWETYGPSDMEPIEYEVVPPGADGCWHYVGGSGRDSTVLGIIHLESRFQIDKVVYTITTG